MRSLGTYNLQCAFPGLSLQLRSRFHQVPPSAFPTRLSQLLLLLSRTRLTEASQRVPLGTPCRQRTPNRPLRAVSRQQKGLLQITVCPEWTAGPHSAVKYVNGTGVNAQGQILPPAGSQGHLRRATLPMLATKGMCRPDVRGSIPSLPYGRINYPQLSYQPEERAGENYRGLI